MSKRARLAVFLISCLLILAPDFAALTTRGLINAVLSDPSRSAASAILLLLNVPLFRLSHPACDAWGAASQLSGPFCENFVNVTIVLALICLSAAVTIILLQGWRGKDWKVSPGARYEYWIEMACGATVAVLGIYKAFTMSLAFYAPLTGFDGASLIFCARYFATGSAFAPESCVLPMTAYLSLSWAALVPAVAWWIYYVIAVLRIAFRKT